MDVEIGFIEDAEILGWLVQEPDTIIFKHEDTKTIDSGRKRQDGQRIDNSPDAREV